MRLLRNFKQICNWNRDYQEQKPEYDSSEDELNESEDLLKDQVTEDSMVEKSVSISDTSDDGPKYTNKRKVADESRDDQDTQRDN